MPRLARNRFLLVLLGLAAAALACTRSELPLIPAQPKVFTPAAFTPAPTQVAQVSPAASPTALPTLEPSPEVAVTLVVGPPTETPTFVAAFPTDTPPPTDTPLPTDTPAPPTATLRPSATLPPTATSRVSPSAPSQTPAAATPAGPQPTAPPVGAIPANAVLTQDFDVTNEGGKLVGRPMDMTDGRTLTWASLRGGGAFWVLDLRGTQNVVGLRVWAQPDGGEPTSLLAIEVSADGSNWRRVFQGDGDCSGTPACDFIQQQEPVDFGFGPVGARYVRLAGGPSRFAFAELIIALAP